MKSLTSDGRTKHTKVGTLCKCHCTSVAHCSVTFLLLSRCCHRLLIAGTTKLAHSANGTKVISYTLCVCVYAEIHVFIQEFTLTISFSHKQ